MIEYYKTFLDWPVAEAPTTPLTVSEAIASTNAATDAAAEDDDDVRPQPAVITRRVGHLSEGCWVSVTDPTDEEAEWLRDELGIVPEFLNAALDDEETSHVDFDDDTGQTLVIVDCPFVESDEDSVDSSIIQYDTHPLAMLFIPERDLMVTVSLGGDSTVDAATGGKLHHLDTDRHARMLLVFLLHISQRYLVALRSINRQFRENERKLRRSMSNSDLMKMLGFEKSLVYFSTSLRGLDATLVRIGYGRIVLLHEGDRDLLEDVQIEVKQALEMCTISTTVLDETMDTFGSLINNNLNLTMRTLAIITLVLSMPTMVFSFYGMNTPLPFDRDWAFPLSAAVLLSFISAVWIRNSRRMR